MTASELDRLVSSFNRAQRKLSEYARLEHKVHSPEPIRSDSPLWPYIAATVPGGARGLTSLTPLTPEQAVDLYSSWVIEQPHLMLSLDELAGKDLACPCKLPEPGQPDHCHAAVLFMLSNDRQGELDASTA